MIQSYVVSIEVEVVDDNALYAMAVQCCEGDTDAIDLILRDDPGEIDQSACVQMIIDPGESPEGCRIIESRVEALPVW